MYIKFQPKNYFLFNQTLIPFTNRQFETIQQLENILQTLVPLQNTVVKAASQRQ